MIAKYYQNEQETAFEGARQLVAVREERACDLCELWAQRIWQKRCVICVNFGTAHA